MDFEEGKLYKCSAYLLMIYPTREKADAGAAWMEARATAAKWDATARIPSAWWLVLSARYWSKELNCTVRYSEPNEIFIFLKDGIIEGRKYLNVLFGDKQGWIVYKNWLKIERVNNGI